MSSVQEEWRPVIGFEGWYSVSNKGRVRRERPVPGTRKGKILKPQTTRYARVILSCNNQIKALAVHRLVAAVFLGPLPHGHQLHHKNGNKLDNRIENLEYVTPSQNIRYAFRDGLKHYGELHHQAKLTNAEVRKIKRLKGKRSTECVAQQYGVTSTAIYLIWKGLNRRYG